VSRGGGGGGGTKNLSNRAFNGYNPNPSYVGSFKVDEVKLKRRKNRHVRAACTNPVVFNSDLGKCRGISTVSTRVAKQKAHFRLDLYRVGSIQTRSAAWVPSFGYARGAPC
jgi:hypothetical protein